MELKFGRVMQEEQGGGEFILCLPAVVFLQTRSKTPLSGECHLAGAPGGGVTAPKKTRGRDALLPKPAACRWQRACRWKTPRSLRHVVRWKGELNGSRGRDEGGGRRGGTAGAIATSGPCYATLKSSASSPYGRATAIKANSYVSLMHTHARTYTNTHTHAQQ